MTNEISKRVGAVRIEKVHTGVSNSSNKFSYPICLKIRHGGYKYEL